MFVWDERKREANLIKHGLDFTDAHYVFNAKIKVMQKLWIKGEFRNIDSAFAEFAGIVLTLVYTMRGEDVRVISFRPASKEERYEYEQIRLGQS